MIHLDFETKCDLDLEYVGVWAYARHRSLEVLCFAYCLDDGKVYTWRQGDPKPKRLLRWIREGHAVHAWNAGFEYAISKHCPQRDWFKGVKQWIDVQAIARMCGLPAALGTCAAALGTKQRKDTDGKRLIKLFCKADAAPFTGPDADKMVNYCADDVRTERAVLHALPIKSLGTFEQFVWEADLRINERGARINVPMVRGAARLITSLKPRTAQTLRSLTGGKIESPGQREKIKLFCRKQGYRLPNLQKPTVAAAKADPKLPPKVRALFDALESVNVSSVAKYLRMLYARSGDRVCGVHRYHAADTGRWGGQIAQFQNIPRPKQDHGAAIHSLITACDVELLESFGAPLLLLRDCIRNAIIPSDGNKLIVTDKSQIEARMVAWLAGDTKALRAFKAYDDGIGPDVYKINASLIFGKPIDEITDDERFLGKESELGFSYSMSEHTFHNNIKNKTGKDLPLSLCRKAKNTYRTLHAPIVKLWYSVEDAAKRCVKSGRPTEYRGIKFAMVGTYLTIRLPSGRRLWYPKARVRVMQTRWGEKESLTYFAGKGGGWWMNSTYGGKLVENITQAAARDLLANALLRMEEKRWPVVMHVHDESVNDVPAAKAERAQQEIVSIFKAGAWWSKGLPLNCSSKIRDYYAK